MAGMSAPIVDNETTDPSSLPQKVKDILSTILWCFIEANTVQTLQQSLCTYLLDFYIFIYLF